ncbi:glycoside hydrolase family 2 TIM barrel-domain containing protein [Flammeovirgaceae bacterium SG7u.111]|nr:glycoside hydrolase family 2 TIM barrel-domain containing protein [Flammeovirgaceae bacterium SG7u.132]WPO37613.1 glycoside hydrolase family 2 TIM barrel-domain containing protein [Flammeovirgaceae bacterium SG7u.111]
MKSTIFFLLCLCLFVQQSISQSLPQGYPQTARAKLGINQGWKFHLGDPQAAYFEKDFDDSSWETVNVPHTLALTSLALDGLQDDKTQLIFHREVAWYRRDIEVSNKPNRKVFLEFEGAHQITDVWVNGKHVGQHAVGGYTPFHFDITDFVEKGKSNQVTLLLDNRRNEVTPPDPGPFDYVKFSGLYRDVYLVETDLMHITFNWEKLSAGINITTPTIDPVNKNATVNIKTVVRNEYGQTKECQVVTRIVNKEGIVVMKLKNKALIGAGGEVEFNQIGSLEDDVQLWGIDNPYLYRVNSMVVMDGKEVDCLENKLGLRKFELDPERGFMLNNEPIELIGMNRHQHYSYIGDALPNSLHYKDMLQFKEYGFNIMRTAHYPQDNAIMDACDELGILVYEEAPSWISMSTNPKWWSNFEKAARAMVRNHRNHPSVVMWGAGINHRGYVPRVHNTIKQEDPTRLTASQGSRWTGWQASGLTDINANMLYGPFIWDRSEPMFAMEGRVGPTGVAPHKRDEKMVGIISWTAHAYYTFHPTHSKANSKIDRTRSGAMTAFRFVRPETEWYKAEMFEEPFIHVKEEWREETKSITVYSNGDEVELLVNGKSIARQKPSADTLYLGLDHPPFEFSTVEFEKGELKAVAYKEGKVLAETVVKSPLKPHAIRLEVDTVGREFTADGSDILLVYAHVVDKNGTTISGTDHLISFGVDGDASVVGDGAEINANPMFTEYGVAPALVRAGTETGEITISAKAKGLKSATATVTTQTFQADVIASEATPIYDFEKIRVDFGAEDQLLQFDWLGWNGKDNANSIAEMDAFGGIKATLETGSSNGVIRWLGEMNVIGKYGFAYADGVICMDDDGLKLSFENLPEGSYKLTTWHHAPRSNSDEMDPNKEKLKTLTIHKLPYEKKITISSEQMLGGSEVDATVTEGQNMQFSQPCISEIILHSDGEHPVLLHFKGKGKKGVWLNAFELSEWF